MKKIVGLITSLKSIRFFSFLLLIIISSVEINSKEKTFIEVTHRSGTIKNDDIEEPLSPLAKKYEGFLKLSNRLVALLREKRYKKIYNSYFSKELKNQVTFDQFEKINQTVLRKFGKMESYKKMQWSFVSTKEQGKWILKSFKIVHHKDAVMYYSFTVTPENKTKLSGFHYRVKKIKGELKENSKNASLGLPNFV